MLTATRADCYTQRAGTVTHDNFYPYNVDELNVNNEFTYSKCNKKQVTDVESLCVFTGRNLSLNVDTQIAWHTSCVHTMYNDIPLCTVYIAKAERHTLCTQRTPARQNGTEGNTLLWTNQ